MANVFFKINMNNKTIILSPISSGKSFFICSQGKHNSYCNEYLSTENNYIKDKNINMGGTSPIIPTSHPLYKSWDEVYKIGVRIFSEMDSNNEFLIFNGGGIISWLKKLYNEIDLKIVIIDKDIHYSYFKKITEENNKFTSEYKKQLLDVNFMSEEKFSWWYINEERNCYKKLAKIYNIPIYKSFEEACE